MKPTKREITDTAEELIRKGQTDSLNNLVLSNVIANAWNKISKHPSHIASKSITYAHLFHEINREATDQGMTNVHLGFEAVHTSKVQCLYDRAWVRAFVDGESKDELLAEPMRYLAKSNVFTYSLLLDDEYEQCDFGFADVCEHHLLDSKVGVPMFIPAEDSDGEAYLLLRII